MHRKNYKQSTSWKNKIIVKLEERGKMTRISRNSISINLVLLSLFWASNIRAMIYLENQTGLPDKKLFVAIKVGDNPQKKYPFTSNVNLQEFGGSKNEITVKIGTGIHNVVEIINPIAETKYIIYFKKGTQELNIKPGLSVTPAKIVLPPEKEIS